MKDNNRKEVEELLFDLELRKYIGIKCEYCGLVYKDLETFKKADPVRFNDIETFRLVCKKCKED